MIVKYTVLAMIVFLGSLTAVQAQLARVEQSTEPVLITLELHNALTRGGTVTNGASMSSPQALEASMSSAQALAAATGWNFVHARACVGYFDGVTTWLYIYPAEGGLWWTGNPGLQNAIGPSCQSGNWLGFYVYNTNGDWNQVAIYPYK